MALEGLRRSSEGMIPSQDGMNSLLASVNAPLTASLGRTRVYLWMGLTKQLPVIRHSPVIEST